MFSIKQQKEHYLNYILSDTEADTTCTITPEKGGMLTSLTCQGFEYIYINEENYKSEDRTRCAVPILFPTTGLCDHNTLVIDGKTYPMGIHGIAHAQKWKVVRERCEEDARITLCLEANETTLASYPFRFIYEITYILKGTSLTYDIQITNLDDKVMPFSFGFHPYFKVSDVRNLEFTIKAKEVQHMDDPIVPYHNIVFPYQEETKLTLRDVQSPVAFTDTVTNRGIMLTITKDFPYLILWSLCKQNFICVEPWNTLPNALNEGTCKSLSAQECYHTQFSIHVK